MIDKAKENLGFKKIQLKELILLCGDFFIVMSLIPKLGWNDKETLVAIQSVNQLLKEYIFLDTKLKILHQEAFFKRVFYIFQEVGIDQVVETLMLARQRIREGGGVI